MALDLLIQEAQGLSEDALMEVVRFMKFIKAENANDMNARESGSKDGKRIFRKAGKYRGQIWIADDFDAPLDSFKEYM